MGIFGVSPADIETVKSVAEYLSLKKIHYLRSDGTYPQGRCYWNCDKYIAENGGYIVYGWQAFGWPNVFLMLMHHAVVRTRNGRLIDPTTPAFPSPDEILFIEDDSIIPPRDYPAFIPNKFFPAPNCEKATHQYAAADNYQLTTRRRIIDHLKTLGIPVSTVDGQLDVSSVPGILPFLIELKKSRDAIDKAADACKSAEAKASPSS